MRRRTTIGLGIATALAALGGPVATAAAEKPVIEPGPDDTFLEFDAGVACTFRLRLDIADAQGTKTFTDRNGNVRRIQAGKGATLTFTNLDDLNQAPLTLRANGSTQHTRFLADGTREVTATGHNVIILFPTDRPKGPSTIQYVGQVRYTADQSETVVQSVRAAPAPTSAPL